MLIPLSWLKKYVDIDMSLDDFMSKMIMSGLAVEGYEEVAPDISGVVVGRIIAIDKHPNADSLFVCQTDIGCKVIQICTAATNVVENALVPVALDGARLAEGLKIKATKMRGEVSEGMFCSYQELGMSRDMYPTACENGILLFEEELPLGADVKGMFGLNDIVIDFDILSNRPDCQSVIGVAREVAAILGVPMRTSAKEIDVAGGDIGDYIKVSVENSELCPRFCGRIIKNVKIAPSPQWMRNALNAVGIRPINNIVDITNYVMLEYGQPMHAYDLNDIRGGEIIVRNAREGETIKTLDEREHKLDQNMLVIADGQGATGIAGVIGGALSEIKPDTETIFFEAASFAFASVRITARKLGERTAASALFEKGVNPATTREAMNRALELVTELGCGEIAGGEIDIYPAPEANKEVVAPVAKLRTLMGVDVPVEEMLAVLERLNIKSRYDEATNSIISIGPAYRKDVVNAADIAEEILRMTGYDKIPSVLMNSKTAAGSINQKHLLEYKLRDILCGAGFSEAMTYSFVSPKVFDQINLPEDDRRRGAARLQNSLGEDYSIMRTSLIPSILQTISINHSRKIPVCKMFEIAPVFLPKSLPLVELPEEKSRIALAMYGGSADFYALKGVVDMVLAQFGIVASYKKIEAEKEPYLHAGRAAELFVKGQSIGIIGEVHPDVRDNYKLSVTLVADLSLEAIGENAVSLTEAKAPPRFPAVDRDVALIMDDCVPVGDCMETIAKAAGKLLDSVDVFDIYRGRGVPDGKKSVAYSYSLRASDRTLSENEINAVFKKLLFLCEKEHGAVLRS